MYGRGHIASLLVQGCCQHLEILKGRFQDVKELRCRAPGLGLLSREAFLGLKPWASSMGPSSWGSMYPLYTVYPVCALKGAQNPLKGLRAYIRGPYLC